MFNIKQSGDLQIFKRLNILEEWYNQQLLTEIASISYDHFMEGFPKDNNSIGGKKTDESAEGWKKRKNPADYPILNKTGNLKKSIKIKKRGRNSISIETNLSYASYQNEKRNFIGSSKKLNRKVRKYIKVGLDLIFRNSFPKKPYLK